MVLVRFMQHHYTNTASYYFLFSLATASEARRYFTIQRSNSLLLFFYPIGCHGPTHANCAFVIKMDHCPHIVIICTRFINKVYSYLCLYYVTYFLSTRQN
ncbi:hypothetical protein BDB00DRAFT_834899 [Zychaea mexicana]|uniref:uncharacterized protein n=1 Tax=Zychaea mexicana TaxID=64656 RepID=UPI0022FED660|nr:uncharacterized protein BDB00DRAFT_834899 [Zychaea mexicana]KAI9491032.1 hypothetical protein BDB00DRAFT_834899 [Zychaea mexicana]